MKTLNSITIAIHDRPGSFSDKWIDYCKNKSIQYKTVNCYDCNIVMMLKEYDALLWHWHQDDTKAILFARQLLLSVEHMGLKVFPNINTCWCFDDKVGQKYILESINVPIVPTYVFYDRQNALNWIKTTDYPKVFKLRGGAGSSNVKLVRSVIEAKKLCQSAFENGFKANAGYFSDFSTKIEKTMIARDYLGKIKRLPRLLLKIHSNNKIRAREKGYIYFQDFIPNNQYDTRITIIGNRAFGFRRKVRTNDFRASGSGKLDYDMSNINMKCISIAFKVADQLKTQSLAIDFIEDDQSNPLIMEISYCFASSAVKACNGFWDRNLKWHEQSIWPEYAIIEDIIQMVCLE
ncbi:MAG TPA: hypothetical protein PK459_07115 [Anaerolineaceae bacterium]|jgi:glutathione synthase/RimK-type ligase-like ATP-grasp enzyme|nr:hypothetical protein [Anaerolineaceae bacterium]